MRAAQRLRSRLVGELAESGELGPDWRDAFSTVPRHCFVPETVWLDEAGAPAVLARSESPERWLEACYADRPLITQLDDGDGSGRGYFSSSISMPTTVAMMLAALDPESGGRVLEIGTGTGYNAALLAFRAGTENVTTVEVDPGIAEQARAALKATGWPVNVVTGDGTKGHPPGAPYDRVLSTASVQRVPYAWVEQTAPGGRVVTPWGTAFHNGALLHLRVRADGTAAGRFSGNVGFMWLRDQRTPHGAVEDRVRPEHDYTESTTGLHPYYALSNFDASFAIGLRVPAMKSVVVFDDDNPGSAAYTVYLMDPYVGSWASWRVAPGRDAYTVRQHGPRCLFEELEDAYRWWLDAGEPEHTRFGLTVTSDGQTVWLDTPGAPIGT
ncbi:methyltransferase domain-containing protein [Spinactinospora alkalitolerans]